MLESVYNLYEVHDLSFLFYYKMDDNCRNETKKNLLHFQNCILFSENGFK